MKKLHISLLAAAALLSVSSLFTSCGGNGQSANDLSSANRADSLSNLLGQLYADDYWKMTKSDSATFAGSDAMEQYRRGIEKGLSVENESDAYIAGLLTGVDIVRYSKDRLQKDYDLNINARQLMAGLKYGLQSDSTVNLEEVQTMLNDIQQQLSVEKAKRERTNAEAALAAYAKGKDLGQQMGTYWLKVLQPGEGEPLVVDQSVNAEFIVHYAETGDLVGSPLPREFKVGSSFQGLVTGQVLIGMKPGEKAVVTTTALDFFGNRCARYNLDPATILSIDVNVGQLVAAAN